MHTRTQSKAQIQDLALRKTEQNNIWAWPRLEVEGRHFGSIVFLGGGRLTDNFLSSILTYLVHSQALYKTLRNHRTHCYRSQATSRDPHSQTRPLPVLEIRQISIRGHMPPFMPALPHIDALLAREDDSKTPYVSKYEARRLLQACQAEKGTELEPVLGARIAYRLGKIGTRVAGLGLGD